MASCSPRKSNYDRAALARCVRLATQNAYLTLQSQLVKSRGDRSKVARGKRRTVDRLEQMERAGTRAGGVRVVKLAGQDRYLARSRTYEAGSYFELWVSPWGHVRCTCPGIRPPRRLQAR